MFIGTELAEQISADGNKNAILSFPFPDKLRSGLLQGLQEHVSFTTQTALSRFGTIPGSNLGPSELDKLPEEVKKTIVKQLKTARVEDKCFDALNLGGVGTLIILGRALENVVIQ